MLDLAKLAKVCELFASPIEGEALSALRTANRMLEADNKRWTDILLGPQVRIWTPSPPSQPSQPTTYHDARAAPPASSMPTTEMRVFVGRVKKCARQYGKCDKREAFWFVFTDNPTFTDPIAAVYEPLIEILEKACELNWNMTVRVTTSGGRHKAQEARHNQW